MNPPLLVLVNPSAGRGRAPRVAERLRRGLTAARAEFEMERTADAGDLTRRTSRFIGENGGGVVAVVGGDGSVHAAVQAFRAAPGRGVLAFVPAGSGNDAARTIGFDGSFAAALAAILAGRERVIDLGLVDGEAFFNGVGAGLDGETAARALGYRRLRRLPGYLAAALATLARYRNPVFRLEPDGGEAWEGPGVLCAVGNGPSCGGGFLLTPQADPADGRLDACLVGDLSRLATLANLPRALAGRHAGHPRVLVRRASGFRLSVDRPIHAHLDGEVRRIGTPLLFSILPAAIRVRAPAGRGRRESG